MGRKKTTIMLVAIVAVASLVGLGRAEGVQRYCNPRFGFCVDYPLGLVMEPEPTNGDGRRLHDSKGLVMIVSGINNVTDDSLESEMQSQRNDFDQVSYQAIGKNWFVLSGKKGDDILYRKTYIGAGTMHHLSLEYPFSLKRAYDPIVSRISRSFTPGELDAAH